MREDTTRTRSPAPDAGDAGATDAAEHPFGDLSGAAREAVRSPADPRLDAHLARLGLVDGPPTAPAPAPSHAPAAAAGVPDPQLAALQAEVERLRSAGSDHEATIARLTERAARATWLGTAGIVVGVLGIIVALIR